MIKNRSDGSFYTTTKSRLNMHILLNRSSILSFQQFKFEAAHCKESRLASSARVEE